MLALLIQSSGFLQLFIDSCEDEGCEETALNWVLAAVVVAIVCTLVMLGIKWFKKYAAINLKQKAWSRLQTVGLIIVGLVPVLLVLLIIWYTTRNFFNNVGIGGLLKGVVFAWLLYVVMMFTGHLLSPWRREIL
jgi:magnesium-transporting ATPase (P-type)